MGLTVLQELEAAGHEEVLVLRDPASGLRAVIAIHDTTLGPAVGGTRMRLYPSLDEAVRDALRLSRAMTYKAAISGVDRGGGKAVILGDPARDKSRALLTAYARAVERLDGRFHTGCDMGIDLRDVAVMGRHTRHISHTPPEAKLDTAGLAALGVFESIRAAARRLDLSLAGLRVAIQGMGQVGFRLARMLAEDGARLTVADVDAGRVERAASELKAAVAAPEEIYGVPADVFSPNAAGGILDDVHIPRLRCRAVVGAANEQLAEERHGAALHDRGILYGPDYLVNAGGLLSLLYETGETDEEGVTARVRAIGDRLSALWERADREGSLPHRVADRMAEEHLAAARAARGDLR
jgi:glutamate dehydrogenase/leucine dehydrogenase